MVEVIGTVADRLSIGARLVVVRIAGGLIVLALCGMATGAFGAVPPGAKVPVTVGSAIMLMAAFVAAAIHGFALERQVRREREAGFTTDRWATVDRPEVAPGTSVVIRDAGDGPAVRGAHRTLIRWARSVAAGASTQRPRVPMHPPGYGAHRDTGKGVLISAFVGGGIYVIITVVVGMVLDRPDWVVVVGLPPAIVAFVSGVALAVRRRDPLPSHGNADKP